MKHDDLIEFCKHYITYHNGKDAYLHVNPAATIKSSYEISSRLLKKATTIKCIEQCLRLTPSRLLQDRLDNIKTLTTIIDSDSKPSDKINAVKLLNQLYQEINQDHNSPVSKISNNINGLLIASETKTSTKSITFNANMTELSHTNVSNSDDNIDNSESNTLDYKAQVVDI